MDPKAKEAMVQDALQDLLKKHGQESDSLDEIVLSYVSSVLDDLETEDLFDLEAFEETLCAYLPEAESVDKDELKEWLHCLGAELERRDKEAKRGNKGVMDLKRVIESTTAVAKPVHKCPEEKKDEKERDGKPNSRRVTRISETSDGGSEGSYEGDDWCQFVGPLLEMFPYSCSLEVNHCLQLMAGDVEGTAQLIMHRHETGQALKPTDRKMMKVPKVKTDEKTLKQAIIGKYGYVDKDDDQRYHRPIVKKNEDKKLIRYRDGKIVSTKGERFTQVSKQESEEMKKTIKI